jgi:hypothetical protein
MRIEGKGGLSRIIVGASDPFTRGLPARRTSTPWAAPPWYAG